MPRFAEIKEVTLKTSGQAVYVNPFNVTAIEPTLGGTKISLNDGQSFKTKQNLNDVLASVQQAML